MGFTLKYKKKKKEKTKKQKTKKTKQTKMNKNTSHTYSYLFYTLRCSSKKFKIIIIIKKNGKKKISLILSKTEMGISGVFFIWTGLEIDFIHISTFTFVQYFLLIHINATVFGTEYPLFGVKSH